MEEHKEKIAIGSDHAGYPLKEKIKNFLNEKGYEVKDYGTHSEESTDYPDYAHPLSADIEEGIMPVGIVICGSGNGVNMTANKHQGVRSALCWNAEITRLARQHNNANVLALPGRFLEEVNALEMVGIFLNTPFEGGRHQKRVDKIPCS